LEGSHLKLPKVFLTVLLLEDIAKYFKNSKSFQKVKILKGPAGNKGYGYIYFTDPQEILKVTAKTHKIFGKLVRISSPYN